MRGTIRVIVVAVVALIVGSAPAGAGSGDSFKTRLTIGQTPLPAGFEGRAVSDSPACRRGRQVLLLRKRRGSDEVVGRDRTDRRGRWQASADSSVAGETFYARAAPKRAGEDRCLSDRSREIDIGEPPVIPPTR